MSWAREIEIASEAARSAGEHALRSQRGIQAETKSDQSPVTQADRECEGLIASILLKAFPDDGLLGEEGARAEGTSGRRWIIDPIDGTRDYVRGNPLWATLIGLEIDGEIAAGVAGLPALGGLYWASRGGGAWRDGERIHASKQNLLSESVLCLNGFNKLDVTPFRERLLDWARQFWAVRSLGGAPDALLVASGQAEVWIEPVAAPWDLAPLKVILEEAGAAFFNFDGGRSIYGGNCIACAAALEGVMREFVQA